MEHSKSKSEGSYYKRNRVKILEKQKIYDSKNREKKKIYSKDYYGAVKEKIKI
jgi:hypothetical protein